jgi:hypothetical protein
MLTALDCGNDIVVTGCTTETPNFSVQRKDHNGEIKVWDVYKSKNYRVKNSHSKSTF